ncbi:hypothetical protein SLEP1_g56577 [Rubroshorea leprosula]|uniref:Uncharacterized protein n=1 Tax=Rubroshorea leprosula TaxID=152421 RepID=A0AAV5MJ60_9ROSI|nr:hypothetical protein SLEP1_g56577 [Rubroshorea leprosula]
MASFVASLLIICVSAPLNVEAIHKLIHVTAYKYHYVPNPV